MREAAGGITKVSGDIYDEVQSLRLEGDAGAALDDRVRERASSTGTRVIALTFICTILWRRMMILARCEKSAIGPMSADRVLVERPPSLSVAQPKLQASSRTKDSEDVQHVDGFVPGGRSSVECKKSVPGLGGVSGALLKGSCRRDFGRLSWSSSRRAREAWG